jgi:molybdopterin-binding protein
VKERAQSRTCDKHRSAPAVLVHSDFRVLCRMTRIAVSEARRLARLFAAVIALLCLSSGVLDRLHFAGHLASAAEGQTHAEALGDSVVGGMLQALRGTSVQLSSEYKDGKCIYAQQFDVRLALLGWRAHLDAALSTEKAARVRLSARKDTQKMQVDVGYLTESTPFGLVIPRSGVTGVRIRTRVDPQPAQSQLTDILTRYGLVPRMESPYARAYLFAGGVRDQLIAGWWLYEPKCSMGLFSPAGHNEFIACSLHQLPAGFGSVQTAVSFDSGLASAQLAYELKAKVDSALGTTRARIARVPPCFSSFVESLGDSSHAWSKLEVSHSRKSPLDLSITWSQELRDPPGHLPRPQEGVVVTGISIGTPYYYPSDVCFGWTKREYVNITDGEGLELRTVLNAGINYLWDYKPCTATLAAEYRTGASASLPGYPGYRGWFEKAQKQIVVSGSFNIYTYLGYITFSGRHLDTTTTRLDETNLRFTSWKTLTNQLSARWDCIPIDPWTAASVTLDLRSYARVIQSCTGGVPGTPGASALSYSLDGYESVSGTISSAVRLSTAQTSTYTAVLSLSGTVELRRTHGSDVVTPILAGKVMYTVKL